MRSSRFTSLSTISIAALALGIAAPANAQSQTPDPAAGGGVAGEQPDPTCENVPVCPERDRCLAGEVELESGQDAPNADQAAQGEIIVTGSRINRPTLSSPVPVTSVGVQDLANQGNVSLGDKLAELPQVRATFTQANSTRFIGTAGINALDLRGLGTQRTLVLVNGRRVVTATPGVNRPDVNSIPIDLVDRVDIVTGGNSAIYGSDAVAGV
ncbi:MAG TPA: TonB-dependent receptor plug domain-containing protein, partial [Acidimicrobiales bacterium]|nr:TonB-dependent receptor plug domain-containing protein [Acidimicrobiales bacterium]